MLRTLHEIYDNRRLSEVHFSDKGTVHSYLSVYEEILAPYRNAPVNVLEIGLFNGSSLKLWEEYFTMAHVYGMDCDEQPHSGMADLRPMIASGEHNIIIGDATDSRTIERYFKGIKFDVVIEDAGHDLNQQLKIYHTLMSYLNEGAIYIIEDVQDIDSSEPYFKAIGGTILDRRGIKNRYDDVLVIIKDKP